jgi:3-dehydroquinate dehydratase type I
MRLVVTILEQTFQRALEVIGALPPHHDAIELRAENLGVIDARRLRDSTGKPIILTYRGGTPPEGALAAAIGAGIDLVDVEYRPGAELLVAPDRTVLSHHDFEGAANPEEILRAMRAYGCAETKLAMSPATLDENLALLRLIEPGVTVIGMGERGQYARVLAPFLGSELAFVSTGGPAAPGQMSLERALAIYGQVGRPRPSHVFAIAGNPSGHSESPVIHNRLFRERGADAAYTIASFPDFGPIGMAVLNGELRGISITAPFKEEALHFAEARGARVSEKARRAGAINTLVRGREGLAADNTDVDGSITLVRRAMEKGPLREAAVIGAGGTARAALAALFALRISFRVFNRSQRAFPVPVEPLERLLEVTPDLIINTLPPGVDVHLPVTRVYLEAAYPERRNVRARQVFSGIDLLEAQAARQSEIFFEAMT